ncbi:MAG TPA: hypothetical protein VFF06_34515 [Polyangia bacterium]|nr:hypothetical protein [Polyangia bacterium]
MKRAALSVALASAFAFSSVAAADDATTTTTPAGGARRVAPLVPSLDMTANTDGSTTVRLALDLIIGLSSDWDFELTPTFMTNTQNGLGGLFNFSGGAPWTAGLSIAFLDLAPQPNGPPTAAVLDVKREAWNACRQICQPGVAANGCERFSSSLQPVDTSPEDLCDAGQKIWLEKYDRQLREVRGRFPKHVVGLGGALGSSQFTYLASDVSSFGAITNVDVAPAGSRLPLSVHTENDLEGRAALSYAYVSTERPFSIELPLTYRYFHTAQTQTTTFCTPSQNVITNAPSDPNSMPTIAMGQTCQTLPLGAPTATHEVAIAAYFGYVNKPDGFWRFGVGPSIDWQHIINGQASADRVALTIQSPIYLNFASAPKSWAGDFKGVVVLTPTAGVSVGTFGTNWVANVSIQIFARRSIFPRGLEWIF